MALHRLGTDILVEKEHRSKKGKRSIDEVLPGELDREEGLLRAIYLVNIKRMATCVGNRLKMYEKALLAREICPKKSWWSSSSVKEALSKAVGCSISEVKSVMNGPLVLETESPIRSVIAAIGEGGFPTD